MDIYLGRDDQQAGPFTPEQIEDLVRAGEVAKTDMIWHDALPCWSCLGMRPEYQPLFKEAEAAQAANPTFTIRRRRKLFVLEF
jgi:hypothetical protein